MLNKKKAFYLCFTLVILWLTMRFSASQSSVFLEEDFNTLEKWKPLYFPKIKRHSEYSIVNENNNSILKAVSNNSASGIVYQNDFNVYEYPIVQWRWKVENVYQKGDATTKVGDDYPIRIYIMFKYDPKKSPWMERIKYNVAKLIYGEYPPDSSLNYIWSSKEYQEKIITSPYTEKSKMILLDKGENHVGEWVTQEVNIIRDHQEAFGHKPPAIASLAIMNDSDNTEEKSISYIDYIKVFN